MRDTYKRQQAIIDRATENQQVNQLLVNNYKDLYKQLVKTDSDIEIFQDTYLNLTRTFQPSLDFNNEFCRQFRMIKTRYQLTDKEYHYQTISLNAISEQAKTSVE